MPTQLHTVEHEAKFEKLIYQVETMATAIEEINKDLKTIQENELDHLKLDLTTIKSDQSWLLRFFWILATGTLGGLITGLLNLLLLTRK